MKFKDHYSEALDVMKCENRKYDPALISPTADIGLFGINLAAHWDEIPGETREEKIAWLQDPINNIDFAYTLFKARGWQDWYMSFNCHKLR